MNKLLTIILVFSILLSISCAESVDTEKVVIADNEIELNVEGMVCAVGCAKFIQKEISNLPGVASCVVDFETGKADVAFSKKTIDSEEIVSKINGLNDGQYKVTVVNIHPVQTKKTSGARNVSKREKSDPEVAYHFPELLTYFMQHLIR